MIHIKIEDVELLVKPQISILEACKFAGITVPRFCYHETLSVSGNCRMCLVEIEGLEKPMASCVAEVDEGMSIWVNSPFVKKARENVSESLLLNHPLDCPICDQAGECDLQDQIKTFGSSYSKFFFNKTSTEDKNCGPLIKTIMTRCIKCTRCVRYSTEVAGVDYFGTMNRGNGTEIGSYVEKMFESEISGNVIDLCPVGALTSKPYAFKARPWELRLSESIDTTDSLGSNIYVNYKETEIFRILAKNNNDLNGSIISDRARFSYDANNNNRINSIYDFSSKTKGYNELSWKAFFENIDTLAKNNTLQILVDEKSDVELLIALKKIANIYSDKIKLNFISRTNSKGNLYIANKTNIINEINNVSDLIVLLGSNLRLENAILNATIRFRYKHSLLSINSFGLNFSENIPTNFINLSITKLLNVFEGKSLRNSASLIKAKKPLILIGENFADRVDNIDNFVSVVSNILPQAKIISLNNISNSEGLNFLNIDNNKLNSSDYVIAINLDDNIVNRRLLKSSNNYLWVNTHGSALATKFQTIIPSLTSFESEQIFINLEARPQKTQKAFHSFFDARKSVDIILAIFNLNYDIIKTKVENYYSFVFEQVSNLELYSSLKTIKSPFNFVTKQISIKTSTPVVISKYFIKQKSKDFYCFDTFTRNSITMQNCSSEVKKNQTNFY
ncbi:MAG TPA: NADH-quinone oxidoreductase subunit NuoG [Chitinophagaceae bacterium]|nr:NADH-quinone oxidoreductase subunit NuoG [Chitinophagaceae bacterium]